MRGEEEKLNQSNAFRKMCLWLKGTTNLFVTLANNQHGSKLLNRENLAGKKSRENYQM